MRIAKKEFSKRRQTILSQMEDNSIAIVPSAKEIVRNRDVEFAFRQDSDFFYLTGFNEPDSVLVLLPGRKLGESVLFCRNRDKNIELWHGYRMGPEGACVTLGVDDAFPIADIDDILPGLIEGRERVYYAMGRHADFDVKVMNWINSIRDNVRSGAHPPGEFIDLNHLLHDMRLFKSASELRVMREAAEISTRAHCRAMKMCQPGMMEYQLEAQFQHEFAMAGARQPAYNAIVGSGKNACILHYTSNDAVLKKGDLVLIDAGCELEYYASDITRTFPVNGKFSRAQKALYELVLKSQLAAIEEIKPGNHWNQAHDKVVQIITEGLVELGLLKGRVAKLIEKEKYKDFYIHRTGHWLGMDVHDVGDYKVGEQWRVLEPGMVLTVEPGIYVGEDNMKVDKKWRGIGIRIEDDVVVTKNGCEVITSSAPKTVVEIEALMTAS